MYFTIPYAMGPYSLHWILELLTRHCNVKCIFKLFLIVKYQNYLVLFMFIEKFVCVSVYNVLLISTQHAVSKTLSHLHSSTGLCTSSRAQFTQNIGSYCFNSMQPLNRTQRILPQIKQTSAAVQLCVKPIDVRVNLCYYYYYLCLNI